jgi:hypothetical protein
MEIVKNNNYDINYIYLCVRNNNYDTFSCIKFNSYLHADEYYKKNYHGLHGLSTMMPVCRYTPTFLHKYILNYKLSKLFITVEIKKI